MIAFQAVKIEVFIPEEYLAALREALSEVQVGVIGPYDQCVSVTQVTGYWRPLPGADPYEGEIGKLSSAPEVKLEVNAPIERAAAALEAIRRVHPYQTPVINVIPLINDWVTRGDLGA